MSKVVSFLRKADSRLTGLTGHIFVTVQDYLGRERRMPADLDGDVAPLGIEDVKKSSG